MVFLTERLPAPLYRRYVMLTVREYHDLLREQGDALTRGDYATVRALESLLSSYVKNGESA